MVVDPGDQNAARGVHKATCETHTGDKGGRCHACAGLWLEVGLQVNPLRWPQACDWLWSSHSRAAGGNSHPKGDGGRKGLVTRQTACVIPHVRGGMNMQVSDRLTGMTYPRDTEAP